MSLCALSKKLQLLLGGFLVFYVLLFKKTVRTADEPLCAALTFLKLFTRGSKIALNHWLRNVRKLITIRRRLQNRSVTNSLAAEFNSFFRVCALVSYQKHPRFSHNSQISPSTWKGFVWHRARYHAAVGPGDRMIFFISLICCGSLSAARAASLSTVSVCFVSGPLFVSFLYRNSGKKRNGGGMRENMVRERERQSNYVEIMRTSSKVSHTRLRVIKLLLLPWVTARERNARTLATGITHVHCFKKEKEYVASVRFKLTCI